MLGRERRSHRGSTSYGSSTRHRSSTCHSRHHMVGTDIIEPTALILMGINIKGHCVVLSHLNIKLFDTVLTEDTEDTTTGILTGNFNNIILRHP